MKHFACAPVQQMDNNGIRHKFNLLAGIWGKISALMYEQCANKINKVLDVQSQ